MIKFEPALRRRIFVSGRFLTGKVAVNHIWGQRVNPLLVGAVEVVATTLPFNGDVYSFTVRCAAVMETAADGNLTT